MKKFISVVISVLLLFTSVVQAKEQLIRVTPDWFRGTVRIESLEPVNILLYKKGSSNNWIKIRDIKNKSSYLFTGLDKEEFQVVEMRKNKKILKGYENGTEIYEEISTRNIQVESKSKLTEYAISFYDSERVNESFIINQVQSREGLITNSEQFIIKINGDQGLMQQAIINEYNKDLNSSVDYRSTIKHKSHVIANSDYIESHPQITDWNKEAQKIFGDIKVTLDYYKNHGGLLEYAKDIGCYINLTVDRNKM